MSVKILNVMKSNHLLRKICVNYLIFCCLSQSWSLLWEILTVDLSRGVGRKEKGLGSRCIKHAQGKNPGEGTHEARTQERARMRQEPRRGPGYSRESKLSASFPIRIGTFLKKDLFTK